MAGGVVLLDFLSAHECIFFFVWVLAGFGILGLRGFQGFRGFRALEFLGFRVWGSGGRMKAGLFCTG